MGDVLSPQSFGLRPPTGGADGYTPHNDLPSWEVGLTQKGSLEIKIRKLIRFNSTVETPWYALSDFYRTAIKYKHRLTSEDEMSRCFVY